MQDVKTDVKDTSINNDVEIYKTKAKELERQLKEMETNKLKEQEKYKELYENVNNELEPTKKELERLQKIENSVKKKLLEAIPKEKREMFQNLSIEQLEAISETFTINKGTSQGVNTDNNNVMDATSAVEVQAQNLIKQMENGYYDKKAINEMAKKFTV